MTCACESLSEGIGTCIRNEYVIKKHLVFQSYHLTRTTGIYVYVATTVVSSIPIQSISQNSKRNASTLDLNLSRLLINTRFLLSRRRDIAALSLTFSEGSNWAVVRRWVLLAGDIKIDSLERSSEVLASLKDREETDCNERADEPHDAYNNPSREKLLAEDVASAVHGHRPEDQESDGQDDSRDFGDIGGAEQRGLLDGHFGSRGVGLAWDELEVDVCLGSLVVVISLSDGSHGLPVVLVDTEDEGEEGSEDERGEQSDDVSCQHRVVGASALNVKCIAGLLCGHQPCDQGAGETEWWSESCSPLVVASPHKCKRGWDDSGGDYYTHHDIEITHTDTGIVDYLPLAH